MPCCANITGFLAAFAKGGATNLASAEARVVLALAPTPAAAAKLTKTPIAAALRRAGRQRGIDALAAQLLNDLQPSRLGDSAERIFASDGQEAFFEGQVRAFWVLGGVPVGQIRYDNLKAAVAQVLGFARQRVETERWVAFRSLYAVEPFYCQPGLQGAHEKGGVEGQIGWFRRNHLVPVPVVDSLAELNAQIEAWDIADEQGRIGARPRTVGEMFTQEAPMLRPLPDEPFETGRWFTPRVDRFSQISIRTNRYSVPVRLIGRRLRVLLHASELVVFADRTEVARHERLLAKAGARLELDHYLEALVRKPGALPGATALEQARASGRFTPVHDTWWAAARKTHGDRDGTRALIQVLLLRCEDADHRLTGGFLHGSTVASRWRGWSRPSSRSARLVSVSLEALAIALTTAVVKAAAKIWLGDRSIAADASAKVFDLVEKQAIGLNDRRKLRLLFTNLESRIADRLLPFIDIEFRGLPDNDRAAAVQAAHDTFERAALTDDDLFATDLDSVYLYRYLLRTAPGVPREFLLSTDGTELYHRVMRECCAYLVQVTSTLPRFQPEALIEILRRETEILEAVRNVLVALPERRHPDDFAADFRRQVVAALDRMELFGADLTGATRLYPLSVAYLSLSVSADHDGIPVDRLEHVLPLTSRILLRGEAGSGKTTMLQWLAVQCASRLLNNVDGWVDLEPFLLRLRRFTRSALPTPERFLDEVGRHIADEMPPGWAQQRLRSGRGVVLVDGIDELPAERRPQVRAWLNELISAFPHARYVVTTRPAAVEPDWLAEEAFTEISLQPMTPRDVRTFVARWHAAMPGDALEDRRDALIATIGTNNALRRLAENPLLCALICALHHTGNGHLPDNRMELYDIALRMLLDRRDVERRVEPDVRLSLTDKQVLLRHLAYWMVRNGYTDAPAEDAEARLAVKLTSLEKVDAEPHRVFRHLLDRGGVLREPIPGRIDFVHRTFGDYLAAKAAVEEDDIGVLVANAALDEWRDVVVLAAGHAHPMQRTKLIEGILDPEPKSDNIKRPLVALACLETSPELPTALREKVKARTSVIVPPATFAIAESLAAAGEFVLDFLAGPVPAESETAAATVRAAALIGGPAALEVLAGYHGHTDPVVVEELLKAHVRFDPAEFAERVLADCPLPDGCLSVFDPAMLAGLEHLRFLDTLICHFDNGYGSLDFVRRLPRLRDLRVLDRDGFDLSALSETPLTHVALLGDSWPAKQESHIGVLGSVLSTGSESVDVAPLSRVTGLTRLTAEVETHGWSRLVDLPDLHRLQLSLVSRPNQLFELAPLGGRLRSLELHQVSRLRDLSLLSFLDSPESLQFYNCDELRDISQLAQWSGTLTSLHVHGCPVEDWAPLARLTRLQTLRLDLTTPMDLSLLSGLRSLQVLRLGQPGEVDLAPLRGRSGLTLWVDRGTKLSGKEALGPDCKILTI